VREPEIDSASVRHDDRETPRFENRAYSFVRRNDSSPKNNSVCRIKHINAERAETLVVDHLHESQNEYFVRTAISIERLEREMGKRSGDQ
jgi:hypothetical protein